MVKRPLANRLTDVDGLLVGNADDRGVKSGVTVVVCEEPAVASVHVMGGAPGTRETDLLSPEQTVDRVDAVVLSGGSAFGLDAAGGVAASLAGSGRGFEVAGMRVPLVPAAILFDLVNGGDKDWGEDSPYRWLGREAVGAAGIDFALGSAGAGAGATTANLKGGLGSASTRLSSGVTVAALVAVNAVGQVTIGDTPHFWAAPFECDAEFGAAGFPSPLPPDATALRHKLQAAPRANTTIAVIATDAILTKAQAKRLAMVTHDGFARAIWPSHTPFDGDLVFALSTGRILLGDAALELIEIGAAASACMARAIARGVYEATPAEGDLLPTWRRRFS
ncbi:MAG: P1 family peptidase [Bauldia sp.]|uniref:P1 family peptidase n=1 Tax=Bauldia sp. TaxID=2575872 RepID=UPI001E0806DD|nr:P1 family peptidase [Bauldia sp.]MCB1496299.1 P1 family peptidase [Bauldia sp.]